MFCYVNHFYLRLLSVVNKLSDNRVDMLVSMFTQMAIDKKRQKQAFQHFQTKECFALRDNLTNMFLCKWWTKTQGKKWKYERLSEHLFMYTKIVVLGILSDRRTIVCVDFKVRLIYNRKQNLWKDVLIAWWAGWVLQWWHSGL